jgi:hypothetical protein
VKKILILLLAACLSLSIGIISFLWRPHVKPSTGPIYKLEELQSQFSSEEEFLKQVGLVSIKIREIETEN